MYFYDKKARHECQGFFNIQFLQPLAYGIYIQAPLFILTYFLFQGILRLPSRSWLTLSFVSLISRYSFIFQAFFMVLYKKEKTSQNGFSALHGLQFLVILFIPQAKNFCPLRIKGIASGYGEFDLMRVLYRTHSLLQRTIQYISKLFRHQNLCL